jgi:predicted DNA-binding transcriptional regulator AlpA
MWEDGGRWNGRVEAPSPAAVSSSSRRGCLAALRRRAGRSPLTVVEVPPLAGVAEAAAILGWDKRRVFTYLSRGSFPEPVAALASGRVWRRSDIEAFAAARRRKSSGRSRR